MDVAFEFQRGADLADAAIHHVARCDDIGAGAGMRQRLLHQRLHRLVVHDVAALVDQSVLPVAGVRIQRDIGDDAQRGKTLLQRAHRALAQTVVLPRRCGVQ